jgi:hypothetical protein
MSPIKQEDFITKLLVHLDDQMKDLKKYSQAQLFSSEVVTLAFLFAIKGGYSRSFYRFVKNNFLHFFPHLPERTWLFCFFASLRSLIRTPRHTKSLFVRLVSFPPFFSFVCLLFTASLWDMWH